MYGGKGDILVVADYSGDGQGRYRNIPLEQQHLVHQGHGGEFVRRGGRHPGRRRLQRRRVKAD